ncbi:MAG: elongation factor 4 [Candidatus Taylorbacteria bacterium]|nr:elongation factor 4 [Candidatus Taylorbacteria bacterium]
MNDTQKIRNFCIIAHIDHGKSTLADRMLELTGTVEKRKMREQVLDSMELERERGITIKMQPVRMKWGDYILNLIDTPGHIDFAYEVSRALRAVEGAVLLVDATQGVQAQTLSTLEAAKEAGLVIIPAVNKIDSPLAKVGEVKGEVAALLSCREDEILECSGRTGQGVREILDEVVKRVPPPRAETSGAFRALVFDFSYSEHRGVIVYVRVTDGEVGRQDELLFLAAGRSFKPADIGIFTPEERTAESLGAGEIGFLVTGIKEPAVASVGETVVLKRRPLPALPGYREPEPLVWASVYPEDQSELNLLRQSLLELRLSDSSFTFEEESLGILGRGFRLGFLGMLHLEIVTERLHREFSLKLVVTTPSISYEVFGRRGERRMVYSPALFPDYSEIEKVREPWVRVTVIAIPEHLGPVLRLLRDHEAAVGETETLRDRTKIEAEMPLRELMRGFFDRLKSATEGYGSMTYRLIGMRPAEVVKLELLAAGEAVPALSRVVSRRRVEEEAKRAVEKLYSILPRQQFRTKIQARALGRIISSRTLSALRKDVTGYLYGGDVTRKKKLLEKQKKGKKKLLERGSVHIPGDAFIEMMKEF